MSQGYQIFRIIAWHQKPKVNRPILGNNLSNQSICAVLGNFINNTLSNATVHGSVVRQYDTVIFFFIPVWIMGGGGGG